jgi:hypothetical protein
LTNFARFTIFPIGCLASYADFGGFLAIFYFVCTTSFTKLDESLMQNIEIHPFATQIPLIITVDEDDKLLLNSPDAEWYRILKLFPDLDFRLLGAKYYDSLYHFNKTRQKLRPKNKKNEDKAQAKQRLLFERATMDEDKQSFSRTILPDRLSKSYHRIQLPLE